MQRDYENRFARHDRHQRFVRRMALITWALALVSVVVLFALLTWGIYVTIDDGPEVWGRMIGTTLRGVRDGLATP